MIYFIGEDRLVESEFYKNITIDKVDQWLRGKKSFSVDTETEGFFDHKNKVIMLQIGDYNDQFVIDTRIVDVSILKPYFESKEVLKLFWNAKFDINFIRFSLGFKIENVYDGFLSECILTTGLSKRELGLGANCLKYCNHKLNKDERNKFIGLSGAPFTDKQICYGAEDVKYLNDIRNQQLIKLRKLELEEVSNLENETIISLAEIEYNGMKLDVDAWLDISNITEAGTRSQQEVLDNIVLSSPKLSKFVPDTIQGNLFGESERKIDINYASPTQVLPALIASGISVESTSEKEIIKYQFKSEFVKELISYKKQSKLASAFGKGFLKFVNKQTGRVHQSIWPILNTGRMSSSEPNLTQIPSKGDLAKKIRACFIPEEGYSIVGGDYSGCELRLITEASQDPVWLEEFNGEGKVHDKVACMMFGIKMSETKNCPDFLQGASYRDVAKIINFGLAYGMSKFKLADTLQISVEEADKLITKFFEEFPRIRGFLKRLGDFGKDNGYIRTYKPYRRIRFFPEWSNNLDSKSDFKILGEIERASMNMPVQGTNADMVKLCLCKLRQIIRDNNYPVRLINVIHDEILTECENHFADKWKVIMSTIMTDCGTVFVKTIPMTVDCKIMSYWSK